MKRKTVSLSLLAIVVILLSGCYERYSKSANVSALKLSPEEQGVNELWGKYVGGLVYLYKEIQDSRAKYNKYSDKGWEFSSNVQSKRYFNAFDQLMKGLELYKPPQGPVLAVPNDMIPLHNALVRYIRLKKNVFRPLNNNGREKLENAAYGVYVEDKKLSDKWRSRRVDFSQQNFSHNLTLEVGAIPFKIDFAKGEVKIKHSVNFLGSKLSFASGPSSRGGIKTLIVQNSKSKRYYAVGGRSIELYLPRSILRTEGEVMTITAVEE